MWAPSGWRAILTAAAIVSGCGGGPSAGGSAEDASRTEDAAPTEDASPTEDAVDAFPEVPLDLLRSGPRSLQVTATFTYTDPPLPRPPVKAPGTHTMTVRVDPGARLVLAGSDGQAAAAPASLSSTRLSLDAPLRVGIGGATSCGGYPLVEYEQLSLEVAPNCTGAAKGRVQVLTGDAINVVAFTAVLTCTPDTAVPRLAVRQTEAGPAHPIDVVELVASEPLPPGSRARLATTDGLELPLAPRTAAGHVVAFVTTGPLWFGKTARVLVDPPFVDLAGNPGELAALPELRTVDRPVQPEDGFEGAPPPATVVVDETQFPIISGKRSAVMPPTMHFPNSARFTARLAVGPTDRVVRFSVRTISPHLVPNESPAPPLTLSVPGGRQTQHALPVATGPFTVAAATAVNGTGLRVNVGPVVAVEAALPPGTRDEVILDANVASPCGTPSWSVGYVIDDLRVE